MRASHRQTESAATSQRTQSTKRSAKSFNICQMLDDCGAPHGNEREFLTKSSRSLVGSVQSKSHYDNARAHASNPKIEATHRNAARINTDWPRGKDKKYCARRKGPVRFIRRNICAHHKMCRPCLQLCCGRRCLARCAVVGGPNHCFIHWPLSATIKGS